MTNKILGYYENDGTVCQSPFECDYAQIELLGSHALEKNAIVLVSKTHLELILQFVWYLGKDGYPITHGTDCKSIVYGRGIKMHKLIHPDIEKGFVVDHINRNRLDNRTTNLRICTQKENSYNTTKQDSSINKYKGIVQQKNNLWSAVVTKNGKKHKIEDIQTEKEAAVIYDAMAEELFGQYAGKNFE